jgi:PAS domain S-box-containing protein
MSGTVSQATSDQPRPDDPLASAPIKVLLVGGNKEEALELNERLAATRRIRVEPAHVEQTAAALARLAQETFDVALLDLTALRPDALPAVAAAAPDLPLIVLVGRDDDSRGSAALQGGAQDYLIKDDLPRAALERSILYAIERRRGQVEAEARQPGWSYAQLIDSLDCIVWEADAATFEFIFVSKQAERILGYPVERWTTEPAFWRDHIHPEDRDWAASFCATASREKRTHEFEYRMISADGRTVWLRDIVTVVVVNDQPVKLRGVMLDITEHKKIEERLALSEERFRALFEQSPIPIHLFAADGESLEANQAWRELYGLGSGPIPHFNILQAEYFHQLGVRPYISKAFAGEATTLPTILFDTSWLGTPDGRTSWLNGFAYPIKDRSGAVREVVFVVDDVTEQKQAEDRLKQQEAQYRAVFEATIDGLVINDFHGNVVEVNPAFYRMHGYTREEMIGMPPPAFVHPDSHGLLQEFFVTIKEGKPFQCEALDVRKDGTVFPVEVHGATFTYNGEPHTLGIVRDLTERRRAEEAIRRSERRYEDVVNSLDSIVWEEDAQSQRYTFVSKQAARLLGYPLEQWLAEPRFWYNHLHPGDREAAYAATSAAFAAGRSHELEYRMLAADGRVVWFRDIITIVAENDGAVKLRGVMVDITEQKRIEQELRDSEEQYRAIFEASTDGLTINTLDGRVVEVNPAFAAMHGYAQEEMRGLDPRTFIHPDDHAHVPKAFAAFRAGRQYSDIQAKDVRKDGTVFPVEVRGTTFVYRGEPHVLCVVRDITERLVQEEQLRLKEEQYRAIFEASTDGLVISDLDGNVQEVNPAFAASLGYTREELIHMSPQQWVHPDSHSNIVDFLHKIRAGERYHVIGKQVRNDGTVFPAEVRGTPFLYNGRRHTLAIIHDITERVQAQELLEQRVEERTRELATLLEVANNVASTLELKPLLSKVLEQLKVVADYHRAGIIILRGTAGIGVSTGAGDPPGQASVEQDLQMEDLRVAGEPLARGETIIIPDILADDPPAQAMRAALAGGNLATGESPETKLRLERSQLWVPLVLKEKLIGTLFLRHPEPGYYTAQHAKLAMAIASQAGIAIENARLYEQAQENTRKTAALAQVASQVAFGGSLQSTLDVLCRRVVEVTGGLASSVILHDGSQLRMAGTCGLPHGFAEAMHTIYESGISLLAQPAFAGQKPVSIVNIRKAMLDNPGYAPIHRFVAEAPWDTVVAVPMIYRDRSVGVLVSYYPPNHEIDAAQMTFHSVIADQAAVAVENARLVAQAHDKARLEERQRLARELHDSVTQALFSISLIARSAEIMLQREGTHSADTLEKLADLRQLTAGALAEMRALIFELRPGALEEEGLLEALRKHTAAVQGREMLLVELEAPPPGDLPRLKPAAEEALYRITQEALHNVVKHARATRAAVCVQVQAGGILLQVRDDGIGFEVGAVPAGHLGLGTMRQRAAALGGEYLVESRPGGGTMITVRVPLAEWQL